MRNRFIVAFEVVASGSLNVATKDVQPVTAPVEQLGVHLYPNSGPESAWAFLGALTERQQGRGGDIAYSVVVDGMRFAAVCRGSDLNRAVAKLAECGAQEEIDR